MECECRVVQALERDGGNARKASRLHTLLAHRRPGAHMPACNHVCVQAALINGPQTDFSPGPMGWIRVSTQQHGPSPPCHSYPHFCLVTGKWEGQVSSFRVCLVCICGHANPFLSKFKNLIILELHLVRWFTFWNLTK